MWVGSNNEHSRVNLPSPFLCDLFREMTEPGLICVTLSESKQNTQKIDLFVFFSLKKFRKVRRSLTAFKWRIS